MIDNNNNSVPVFVWFRSRFVESLRMVQPSQQCLVLVYFMILIYSIGATQAVPCFCTDNQCKHGYCESPWCLVGIRHDGRVIRTCGGESADQLAPCMHDVGGEWQDVCACTTPYCNTFAFLRDELRSRHVLGGPSSADDELSSATAAGPIAKLKHRPSHHILHFDRALSSGSPGAYEQYSSSSSAAGASNSRRSRKNGPDKDDPVVFQRADDKSATSIRQSYLIVVLVVVPLAIATTAIAVVVVGYYCKMC